MNTQDHLTTLRQAANRNLAALASGQVKAQLQAQKAAKLARQKLEQELAQQRRKAFQAALWEVKHLEEELEALDHLMENIGEIAAPGNEMGALEEVDHRRDQVLEQLGQLRDYWQL